MNLMFQNDYLKNIELDNYIIKKNNLIKKLIKPNASVIIVTYNNIDLLLLNLDNLNKQTINDFEIIIIDNNEKIDIFPLIKKYPINYVKLKKNYGLSFARNIGIKLARGEIVIFLDDDAIPASDFVEQHIKAYQINDIIGLRGKAIPTNNKNIYNHFSYHYNYGNKTIPYYINLEGNSSFKKEELSNIGGFNPKLEGAGGYEGLELTYRILGKYRDKNKLIYYPNVVIYHDYSKNFINFIKKRIRHKKNFKMLKEKYKDIFDLIKEYKFNQNLNCNFNYNKLDLLKIRIVKLILSILYL